MMLPVVTGPGGEGGVGEDTHLPSCPTSGPTPVHQQEDCSLEETVDLKHREAEAGNTSASWRDESINDDSDEDEDDTDGEDDDDYEDEEAAEEWLKRYYMRQRGLPEVLATLPNTIKVSLVPEIEEDRVRREQKQRDELAKRREEYRKKMASQSQKSQEKGKRKFGDRMTLEEAERRDFDNGQDYVDFLNSKLQNVSIKMTK